MVSAMMSTERKFIYVHVPKTGGNSIQSSLQPFSDDNKVLNTHQDGINRFNIIGPNTSTKHMTLAGYKAALEDISKFFVFFSARQPFRRAISAYFSPSNWAKRNASGAWEITPPVWNYSDFLKFVCKMDSIVSYVKLGAAIYPVNDIIKLESIDADYARIKKVLHISDAQPLGHVNKTAGQHRQIDVIFRDNSLRQIVEDQFAEDMTFLGY
jgi:Sulfotransferase family